MKIDFQKPKRALIQTTVLTVIAYIIWAIIYFITKEQLFSWKFMISLPVIYFLSNYFFSDKDLKWRDIFGNRKNKFSN